MAVRANDRHNISLVVVGILVALAVIGLDVVLVGLNLFCKQTILVVEAAGHAAVFLRAQEFLIVNHWIIW